MVYIVIDFICKIFTAVVCNLPWSLVGVAIFLVIFLLWLVPGLSHIPAVIYGAMLQFSSILLTVVGAIINLAISALYGWMVGIYNDLCVAGNLFIDTVLENLCPGQDVSQCIGLQSFLTSLNNAVESAVTVISMVFDLFQLVASLGGAVMSATRQFNAVSRFNGTPLSAFDAFKKSTAGRAFASYSQNNKFAFDGLTSLDVGYLNDTVQNWRLFTSDAPICADPLCRDPSQDGMMYFDMLNASHAKTSMFFGDGGFRVPTFLFAQSNALDILTSEEIRIFAGQVAAVINAIFAYALPVATQLIYFGMDLFKLLAVLFVIILLPFLKPLATLLLLFYYVLGQPAAGGSGTVYVPSVDATEFLNQYVDSAIANYIKKYALEARTYLLKRSDVPGPIELKQFLLGVINVLDVIISLPSQLALLIAQIIDKVWCFISHAFPCMKLGNVCDLFFANPAWAATGGKVGIFNWVFSGILAPLTGWAQPIVWSGCWNILGGTCPCSTCKPDPDNGILRYITIPGDGYPCVPDHSVSGHSCCVGSSIIHWIPPVAFPIFGIRHNGTLPKDIMFAIERNDLSTLMRFASVM